MIGGVYLLHLHLCVNVAVGEEVDVGILNLRDGVLVNNHLDDIIQGQEGVALNLSVHVLAHGAASQQSDQLDMVAEGTGIIHPVPFTPHHLQEVVEGSLLGKVSK